jgi:hypothetical protein
MHATPSRESAPPLETAAKQLYAHDESAVGRTRDAKRPWRIDAVLLLSGTRARLNVGEASGRVAPSAHAPD